MQLYTPTNGQTTGTVVNITWEEVSDPYWEQVQIIANGQWDKLAETEYTCTGGTCSTQYSFGTDGTNTVQVWMTGESSNTATFTVDSAGTGNESTDGTAGTVTLAEGATVDISTGITTEQMVEVGGSIVLALVVAGSYKMVKDFMLNR